VPRPEFSLVNHAAAAGTTVAGSTADSVYVAANAKSPHRPFLPWRSTTVASEQTLVFDFQAAVLMELLALINVNFTTFEFQANATDSWGSPTFESGDLTVSRNPENDRYQLVHDPGAPPTLRFLRVRIPAQTPTDGAAYFKVGGVWAGPATAWPRSLELGTELETVEPQRMVAPDHGGFAQRLRLGEPFVRLRMRRKAYALSTPLVGAELLAWQEIDRQTRETDAVLVWANGGATNQAWCMRRLPPRRWTVTLGFSEADLELEELRGP
jgi:hypothetical protein